MHPSRGAPPLACPVCGRPLAGPGPAPCPGCGLPGAGQAAVVVARIGATLGELARDRDALLATLHAAAPGAPPTGLPAPPPPAAPAPAGAPAPRHPRLSPQQVLLGLGALLVVAGAVAFVALGWTRLGLAFQAAVMVALTGAACAVSGWVARRRLRATEEALAAAGAALLGIDLGAAWAKDLLGLGALPLRPWAAAACAIGAGVTLALGRLTRSTAAWPLAALLAVQPVPLLLVPPAEIGGPGGVAAALLLAALDAAVATRLRRGLAPVGGGLAALWAATAAVDGLGVAAVDGAARAWPAAAVLAAGGALAAAASLRARSPGGVAAPVVVVPLAAGVVGLAAGLAAHTAEPGGPVAVGAAGLSALGAAALLVRRRVAAVGLLAGGATAATAGGGLLLAADRLLPLSVLLLAAALPAGLAAIAVPRVRRQAAAATAAAPALAVLTARTAGNLPPVAAVLLLALLGAGCFAAAAARVRRPEEAWLGGTGVGCALLAGAVAEAVDARGLEALALAIAGAAAACAGLAAGRRWVATAAVADLVVSAWLAAQAGGIATPEAYTLPAAAGLLLAALPGMRSRASSWATEGAAAAVALVPSALLSVTDPTTVRLALVVSGAVAVTVVGTITHRQAPFVVGSASSAFVVLARLGPYAPLLPRWLLLSTAGALLLAVGATYERRRQQAREAVAWVAQMR